MLRVRLLPAFLIEVDIFCARTAIFCAGMCAVYCIKIPSLRNNRGMKKRVLPADEARTRDERESCFPAFSAEEGKHAAGTR